MQEKGQARVLATHQRWVQTFCLKVLDYLCTLIFDLYDQHLRFIRFIRYSVLIIQGLQDYLELLFRLQALLLCRRCLCLSGTAEAALAAIVG